MPNSYKRPNKPHSPKMTFLNFHASKLHLLPLKAKTPWITSWPLRLYRTPLLILLIVFYTVNCACCKNFFRSTNIKSYTSIGANLLAELNLIRVQKYRPKRSTKIIWFVKNAWMRQEDKISADKKKIIYPAIVIFKMIFYIL